MSAPIGAEEKAAGGSQVETGLETLSENVFRRERRSMVARSPGLRGLEYVASDQVGPRAWRLSLFFIPGPGGAVPAGLDRTHLAVRSSEGVPVTNVEIARVELPAQPEDPRAEVFLEVPDAGDARALARDGGVYSLEIINLPQVDRFFSRAPFSFSTEVVSEPMEIEPPRRPRLPPALALDYLAKDYQSFRSLMLDRMADRVPQWSERNPSDLGVAIVEVLAYVGDYLSYQQDATATEAYLQTARRRISVRRLARLVDYRLGEGRSPRVWVQVELSDPEEGAEAPVTLARGTQLLTGAGGLPGRIVYGSWEYEQALAGGSQVFETVEEIDLHAGHGRLELYAWGVSRYTLPAGATGAALAGHLHDLRAGDVLILEQVRGPRTGRRGDADPGLRHAVRLAAAPTRGHDRAAKDAPITEVRWFEADALPFSLPVTATFGARTETLAVARGNVVLADGGRTVIEELEAVEDPLSYRPRLARRGLVFRAVADRRRLRGAPAAVAYSQPPAQVLPAVTLTEIVHPCPPVALEGDELDAIPAEGETWLPQPDLLASGRFARDFVVEMTDERQARLRFGNGRYGRLPDPGATFRAYYRVGQGAVANAGPGAIAHVVSDDERITGARNPLPARGARAPEELAEARLSIPTAFHGQRRLVVAADFVAAAERQPDVLAAAAELLFNGSWTTARVYVQRRGGRPVEGAFAEGLEARLEPLTIAGYDLAVRPPRWVALEIELVVTLDSSHYAELVLQALMESFSAERNADGGTGYFYPDNFTFGQPVFLSELIARASEVAGVVEVETKTFRRLGERGKLALERGFVAVGEHEIVRVRNQPQAPEQGTIAFQVEGGR